ncbi:hypothetical protein LLH00_05960 [bacterium]|nr:hypothetical protein [bacterium]
MGVLHMGLRVTEAIEIVGELEVTLTHAETGEKIVRRYRNRVVNGGLELIAARLAGEGNDCAVGYAAVGTDATPPAAGDTTLGAELARKPLTTLSRDGSRVNYSAYFSPSEANGDLKEFAVFADGATGTPGSGTMFNRALINVSKTAAYTMTVTGSITIRFKES